MKIVNLKQGSSEWDAFRRIHIGASEAPAIAGVDPYTKPEKLWHRKFTGEKQYVSPAMRRGTELEPLVRKMLERTDGVCYLPLVVQHDEHEWMIASLDGYDESTKKGIEIKCPGDKLFNQIIIDRDIPKHYIYQIQHQMSVTNLHTWSLIVFNGTYFEEFHVDRDEDIIQELIEKEQRFYQSLLEGEFKV